MAWVAGMGLSWAQTPPSAATILKQQEAAMPPSVPKPSAAPVIVPAQNPAPVAAGGASVQVRSIRLVGGQGWAQEEALNELVRPAVGQRLSAGELMALAERVSSALKAQGWLLAQAFLPPQDVTEGDIVIRLLPGSLDGGLAGIVVQGAGRVSAERIRAMVAAPMADQEGRLNAQQLEEGLLRAAELSGVSATASLERGSQPGTSRLSIEAKEAPLAAGSLTLDNFGGRLTGVQRATGLLSLSSPLGLGESLMFNMVGSSGIAMLTTMGTLPVGHSGLKLGASVTSLRYKVGGELADLDLQGRALMAGVNASYPLVLTPAYKVRARLGLDRKVYVDSASGIRIGDKVAQVSSAGLSGQAMDALWGGGLSDWSIGLDHGQMDLSRLESTYEQDQAGPRAHGRYQKWQFAFTRLQPLGHDSSAQFSVNGQLAGKNLDASEKFMLGGNSAIRAYAGGEGAGDSGVLASMTLRHEFPGFTAAQRLELSGFYDWGRVRLHHSGDQVIDSATGLNLYNLSGIGVGLGLAQNGAYRLNLVWARPLGSNPGRSTAGTNSDGKPSASRVLLSLSLEF